MTDRLPAHVWRLGLIIACGAFMGGLDASLVNVGLDTITRDLDSTIADAQWATNAYLIALAASLPACGWLARRIGVGRLWLICMAGFTISSGLCALAADIGWLIAFRVLQGLTAGILIPAGQTVLGQVVGPNRLGRVMATLGVAVTLAPALGPVVGGVLVHAGSWHWLFLVNLPVGGIALLLGVRYVPRGKPAGGVAIDWRGLLLLTAAVPLVVYGVTDWGQHGTVTSTSAGLPMGLGLALLSVFVLHARARPDSVLNLRLFANPSFAAASITAACTGAAMFGAGLLFPLLFQIGRGESVIATGLQLISLSIGTVLVLPLSGWLVDRFGGGIVSVYGGLLTVATTAPFAVLDANATGDLTTQALLFLRGTAVALAMTPAMSAAYKAVAADQLPDATTLVNILLRVGGALGGAVLAVILSNRLAAGSDSAFETSFALLTGMSTLGLLAALWLAATERRAWAAARAY